MHQLMRFVETVTKAGCSREQNVTVLLIVEKAFDRVYHDRVGDSASRLLAIASSDRQLSHVRMYSNSFFGKSNYD